MAAKRWRSTGFRVPLIFSATIAAAVSTTLSINPQMDFRGENVVIDPTVIGPACTLTMPTVGTVPQIAGGSQGAQFPGTLFSPLQTHALDFKMNIANQGNALSMTVTNVSTASINFAAAVFGTQVEEDTSPAGHTAGVSPAGSYYG